MDLSIWIFREGAPQAEEEDAGPAARAVPVALSQRDGGNRRAASSDKLGKC